MTAVERLQEHILKLAQGEGAAPPLSAATQAAFRAVPRHRFVRRFLRGSESVAVVPENLGEHLAVIYKNDALGLWSDKAKGLYSTISQPTLVLQMLELLRLEPGQTVFELGAGSGWNAAMMGQIVGPAGRVFSSEIIPEMARSAEEAVAEFGGKNIRILTGDGGEGHAPGAPYDRMVFTAGSHDLPLAFHEQMREGGLLLMVLKVTGGGDELVLFERKQGYFESRRMSPCRFVPMTGPLTHSPPPGVLEALADWPELSQQEIERRPFWLVGEDTPGSWLPTAGVRSFLGLAEPLFRVFTERAAGSELPRRFIGLHDREAKSLTIARRGTLVSYGNPSARDRLLARLHEWVELGMPTLTAMRLRVFPIDTDVASHSRQWIVKRKYSQFVWSL